MGTYNSEVLADTPLAYWKLNETSGYPQDSSGNGNHFTSGSTLAAGTRLANNLTPSKVLPNTTVRVQRAAVGNWAPGNAITFECWVDPTGGIGASGNYLYNQWAGGQNRDFMIAFNTDGYCGINSADNSSGRQGGSGASLPAGPKHVVVAVGADNVVSFYANGKFITDNTWTNRRSSSSGTITIGRPPDTYWGQMTGRFSHIAIYQQKLPAARVVAHYQAGTDIFMNSMSPMVMG